MHIKFLPLLCSLFLFVSSAAQADDANEFIEMLSLDIQQSKSNEEAGTLHVYRARQYSRIGKLNKAQEDYDKALELNHKGWIHLERSQFFLALKKHTPAYEEAKAAKEENPSLTREADKVINVAEAEIRKEYEAENPPTIIMDQKADRKRKSRFDVMRETGVFAANAMKNKAFRQQRTAAGRQQKVVSRPTAPPKA